MHVLSIISKVFGGIALHCMDLSSGIGQCVASSDSFDGRQTYRGVARFQLSQSIDLTGSQLIRQSSICTPNRTCTDYYSEQHQPKMTEVLSRPSRLLMCEIPNFGIHPNLRRVNGLFWRYCILFMMGC